jgi:hypothetical protein
MQAICMIQILYKYSVGIDVLKRALMSELHKISILRINS